MKVKIACEKDKIWMDRVDDCGRFQCSKCKVEIQVEIPIE